MRIRLNFKLVSNRLTLFAVLAIFGSYSFNAQAQADAEFFSHEIRPIMERTCWNCHGEAVKSSGLDLSTREAALEGGCSWSRDSARQC